MNGELKMNGIGNGPVVALSFLSSFTVGGQALADLVVRALVMLLVALLGKAADLGFKLYLERRRERRRKRALDAESGRAELKGAEKV
jgi:hypothetical protein